MPLASQAQESIVPPFTAFNFHVEIEVPGVSTSVCRAAFAECEGLEMSMQVKTIREGGNNTRQIHLSGPASYGQVTLRRGMTPNFDLWDWFDHVQHDQGRGVRADAEIVMLAADGRREQVRFLLERCVPVRVRAPALNATDGLVAIEEVQLAYERLSIKRPEATDSSDQA